MNLVFASGFLFPQRVLGQDYFRGVRRAFPQACFPRVPAVASIEVRAQALVAEITRFPFPDPAASRHIVAHSMGGLDVRYALHRNIGGLAARVASVSTIATPHRGSPIADLLVGDAPGARTRPLCRVLGRVAAALGLSMGGLGNLTTSYAVQFNRAHPDIGGVPCYCYAGTGADAFPLRLTAAYIRRVGRTRDEQDNDGLVSVASASWTGLAEPPWPADHLGEVGHSLRPPRFAASFAHLEALRRVIACATAG